MYQFRIAIANYQEKLIMLWFLVLPCNKRYLGLSLLQAEPKMMLVCSNIRDSAERMDQNKQAEKLNFENFASLPLYEPLEHATWAEDQQVHCKNRYLSQISFNCSGKIC